MDLLSSYPDVFKFYNEGRTNALFVQTFERNFGHLFQVIHKIIENILVNIDDNIQLLFILAFIVTQSANDKESFFNIVHNKLHIYKMCLS